LRLTEVLSLIESDWRVMTGDECVPVKVALELLDTSSLGKAYMYDEFQQIHARLQNSLQKIVNGIDTHWLWVQRDLIIA
jgi:exocyst complex component 4